MKENILYLSNATLPSKTANSVHVMKMSNAFTKAGYSVELIAPKKSSELNESIFDYYGVDECFDIHKIKTITCMGSKLSTLFYNIKAFLYVWKIKPDFVYGRSIIACCFSLLMGVKGGLELHSPPSKFNFLELWLFNKLVKNKERFQLIVISQALKDIFLYETNINSDNIFVHHDGADPIRALDNTPLLQGDNSKPNVGYVGHLYAGRGIDIIFELAEKRKDINFHLVGGNEKDIEFWRVNKLLENVFFYGHLPNARAEEVRVQFDILLAPYQSVVSVEGKGDTSAYMSPLKIFEYMATNKPIICSDLPVLREVLNEQNSMLVGHDNIADWLGAINILLKDQYVSKKIATLAYNEFLSSYTWENRAKNIIKDLNRS